MTFEWSIAVTAFIVSAFWLGLNIGYAFAQYRITKGTNAAEAEGDSVDSRHHSCGEVYHSCCNTVCYPDSGTGRAKSSANLAAISGLLTFPSNAASEHERQRVRRDLNAAALRMLHELSDDESPF